MWTCPYRPCSERRRSKVQQSFSGRRQCGANVRLLSPQLVSTGPPFDLSLPFPSRSGSLPGAARVDGGGRRDVRQNPADVICWWATDDWIYGDRRKMETRGDGGEGWRRDEEVKYRIGMKADKWTGKSV